MSAALRFTDETTHGERRALMEKDDAERRLDAVVAVSARRYGAIERNVRRIGEVVAHEGTPRNVRDLLNAVIVDLRRANRVRETDGPADSGGKD